MAEMADVCTVVDVEPGSEEWRELRKESIGASDAPIILGLSPWQSPRDLAEVKLGMTETDVSDKMQRGHDLQPLLLEYHARKLGWPPIGLPAEVQYQSKQYPFMTATIDGPYMRESLIVEAKTTTWDKDWGSKEDPEVPIHIMPQIAHQLIVTGADIVDVVVLIAEENVFTILRNMEGMFPLSLFDTLDFRYIRLHRKDLEETFPALIEAEKDFFEQVLQAKELPADILRDPDNGEIRDADDEEDALLVALKECWSAKAHAEEAYDLIVKQVKEVIGDSSGLKGTTGKVTHKLVKGKPKKATDWEALGKQAMTLAGLSESEQESLIEKHTTEKQGKDYKRFVVPTSAWKKG